MTLELAEIQGLIASGYGDRPAAAYALFAVTDPAKARAWLGRSLDRIQFADFLATPRDAPPFLKQQPLNIAFTYTGLEALGLMPETLAGFSTSFREGMAAPHRARQLGDDEASAPEHWRWGGPRQPEIHGLLCAFGGQRKDSDDIDNQLDYLIKSQIDASHGLALVRVLPTHRAQEKELRKEHFGFRDGISNPQVEGLVRGKGADCLKAGEVLLGYENAYGKLSQTARVRGCDDAAVRLPRAHDDARLRDFGKNGSYLVFRQIEQRVAAFWQYAEDAARKLDNGQDAVWLASRMVGRWPDGSPLTLFPHRDSPADRCDLNDFLFADHDDAFGERCPIGSHVRRANPRDTVLAMRNELTLEAAQDPKTRAQRMQLVAAHRLLRRGRPYGPPLHPTLDPSQMRRDDGKERGLYFLCFNANLRRQFEFVQSSWVVNPHFAGLHADPDPLIAAGRARACSAGTFTVQGCPTRRVALPPRVVETRGGAYFFMPSRSALNFLSELRAPCLEHVPEGESDDALALAALHVDKLQRDFAAQAAPKHARRGFHAKCHGIVRATVHIDDDLAPSFRAGVFVPGARYPAWVRFSSASFALQSDQKRDVHGFALKLMAVPDEPRAASFERQTQDFVLIDAPSLMVGTVRQALAFDRAQVRGVLSLLAHLAMRPDELSALRHITSAPRHLFERPYTSVTPFAHGRDRAVRYVVRVAAGQRLEAARLASDSLRTALRAQLAGGDLTLELCLQTRGLTELPIEDARVAWPTEAQRVARITLHGECFDSAAQERFGERLSFNPWNALEAHKPLGGLNRARRIVYRAVYELRSRLNREPPLEPTPSTEVNNHDHQAP